MASTGIRGNSQQRKSLLKSDLFQVVYNQLQDEDGFGSDTLYFLVANGTDGLVSRIEYGALSDLVKQMSSVAVTSNHTATTEDQVLLCTGTLTVTLPASSGATGFNIYIKNVGSGVITVDGDSSETIDGSTSISILASESRHLFCDGSEWWII